MSRALTSYYPRFKNYNSILFVKWLVTPNNMA